MHDPSSKEKQIFIHHSITPQPPTATIITLLFTRWLGLLELGVVAGCAHLVGEIVQELGETAFCGGIIFEDLSEGSVPQRVRET